MKMLTLGHFAFLIRSGEGCTPGQLTGQSVVEDDPGGRPRARNPLHRSRSLQSQNRGVSEWEP